MSSPTPRLLAIQSVCALWLNGIFEETNGLPDEAWTLVDQATVELLKIGSAIQTKQTAENIIRVLLIYLGEDADTLRDKLNAFQAYFHERFQEYESDD